MNHNKVDALLTQSGAGSNSCTTKITNILARTSSLS